MGLLDRIALQRHAAEPPVAIDLTERNELRIEWPDGLTATLPAARLRDLCPCAECIEEGTGRKLLDPTSIPADIRPEQISPVGNYAIQIAWSDGHSTGLYTWPLLRDACRPAAPAP
jgi:DUF971 family protein